MKTPAFSSGATAATAIIHNRTLRKIIITCCNFWKSLLVKGTRRLLLYERENTEGTSRARGLHVRVDQVVNLWVLKNDTTARHSAMKEFFQGSNTHNGRWIGGRNTKSVTQHLLTLLSVREERAGAEVDKQRKLSRHMQMNRHGV